MQRGSPCLTPWFPTPVRGRSRGSRSSSPASGAWTWSLQSVRTYPLGTTAGHLLGYLRRNDDAQTGENSYFNYYLPDYRGVVGIEGGFDAQLRGRAGGESVLVNNLGYRQSENILDAPEPGNNVVLTIDLDIQRAAEASLLSHQGPDARGAVVVMDVRNGDVLAMVSSPAFNPNDFVTGFTPAEWQRLNDTNLLAQYNRATQENLRARLHFQNGRRPGRAGKRPESGGGN